MTIRPLLVCLGAASISACSILPAPLTASAGSALRVQTSPQASATGPIHSALSARILGSGQSSAVLVRALISSYGQQVDAVLDREWTPAFTDSLLAKPAVRQLLAKGKSNSRRRGGKAQATAADVIPEARLQIEQRRAALHAPLEALQTALLARLESQTRAMDAMNTMLATGGRGALPADVSQSAAPPPAALTLALEKAGAAVLGLSEGASRSPQVLADWPKLAAEYQSRLQNISMALHI